MKSRCKCFRATGRPHTYPVPRRSRRISIGNDHGSPPQREDGARHRREPRPGTRDRQDARRGRRDRLRHRPQPDLLASLRAEIEAEGGIAPIVFEQDFVAPDGPQRIAAEALEALGHVDILVNNAGGSRPMTIDAPEEEWVEGMTLNFDRHRQLTQQLLSNFLERKAGAIISLSGNLEPEVVNAAMVAKAGLVVWSNGLSEQLGRCLAAVNCVQLGLIDTAQIRVLSR